MKSSCKVVDKQLQAVALRIAASVMQHSEALRYDFRVAGEPSGGRDYYSVYCRLQDNMLYHAKQQSKRVGCSNSLVRRGLLINRLVQLPQKFCSLLR